MGVQKWRHVVIGISPYHLRRDWKIDEEEDIIDEQAGHSSRIAN